MEHQAKKSNRRLKAKRLLKSVGRPGDNNPFCRPSGLGMGEVKACVMLIGMEVFELLQRRPEQIPPKL